MPKIFVNELGDERDYAYMDGYSVGDRLLEGCMFRCTIVGDKIEVEVTPACASYFSGLNTKKWLADMTEAANDLYADSFTWDEKGQIDAFIEDEDD